MERVILHSDCNSFYASVECLYRPEIRNKPVAVGGDVETRHGIILTKNQIAKKYSIKTGETIWKAKQKCPELIIVPPNFPLYMRFSKMAHQIYLSYTDKVEPFGLDECWLDISKNAHNLNEGFEFAKKISSQIKNELGITVSIGVSFNKIFAKLGSDYKKPDAITVITKDNFKKIVWPLPAQDLLYVGRSTKRKLQSIGIHTIGELACTPPDILNSILGKWGNVLHCFSNGLDTNPVTEYDNRPTIKSIGNSTTTPRDLENVEDVKIILFVLADSVARRLREQGLKAKTVCISVRDNQLYSFTRQHTMEHYTNITSEIEKEGMGLFHKYYNWNKPVRSIGISVTDFVSDKLATQTDLFSNEAKREKKEQLDRSVDWLKKRFGSDCVQPAILLSDKELSEFDPKKEHTIHPVGYF